jgi:hypothetical protein
MKGRAAEEEYLARESMYDEMTTPTQETGCLCPTCVLSYLTKKILATSNPEYALETVTGDLSALVKLGLNLVSAHGLH